MGLKDLAGIACDSSTQRNNIIKWLNEDGVTEFNGIPLKDFIVVRGGGGESRTWIADNFVGLKDGVLQ